MSRKKLSKRVTALVHLKYNPIRMKEKLERAREMPAPTRNSKSLENRWGLLRTSIPSKIKEKNGYRANRVWSEEQDDLLVTLCQKYRKSPVTIDWQRLVEEQKATFKDFPTKTLDGLRKHYWSVVGRRDPGVVAKRRKAAIQYKLDHPGKFRANQDNLFHKVRKSAKDFLQARIPIRTEM